MQDIEIRISVPVVADPVVNEILKLVSIENLVDIVSVERFRWCRATAVPYYALRVNPRNEER